MSRSVWMVLYILIAISSSIHCAKSNRCPKVNNSIHIQPDEIFITEAQFLKVYRYKSVDRSIKSPFYFDEQSDLRNRFYISLSSTELAQICGIYSDNARQDFETANIIASQNTRIKFNYNPEIRDETYVFCGHFGVMKRIYVIDAIPGKLLTLYGCVELEVKGSMVKHEGVLVMAINDNFTTDEKMKKSRDTLLAHTGIEWSSLKPAMDKNVVECNLVQAPKYKCKKNIPLSKSLKGDGVRNVSDLRFWMIMLALQRFFILVNSVFV